MLPTKKSKKETDSRKLAVFLYGQSKIGKTTFLSGLFGGDVLFLDTEKGTKNIEVFSVQIETWSDFMEAAKELKKKDHPYKCVAVDTVDELREKCLSHVCQRLGIPDKTHPKFASRFGQGYALLNHEFSQGIKLLLSCDIGIFFVSHEKSQNYDQNGRVLKIDEKVDGPIYTRTVPSIGERQRLLISSFSDVILRAGIENHKRVLRALPTATVEAGDRTGVLPSVFNLCSEEYMNHFRQAFKSAQND
jgi:hypothetical protein